MSDPAPKRRWFRFNLQTFLVFLVLVACVALVLGWVVSQRDWIRQRREFIEAEKQNQRQRRVSFIVTYTYPTEKQPRPPALLWIFGENGTAGLYVLGDNIGSSQPTARDQSRLSEAKRLFPEAAVYLTNEYHDSTLGQSVYQGTVVP
jgi:hypothetical protein